MRCGDDYLDRSRANVHVLWKIRLIASGWNGCAVSIKKGDREMNPFWDSHDNHTTRRSYLLAELRNELFRCGLFEVEARTVKSFIK
jgi:hypothetical protein